MLRATLGEPVPLQIQLSNGQTDLYGRVKVYDDSGTVAVTLSLVHIDNGLYGASYTFNTEGHYTAVYQIFKDNLFTEIADFNIEAESIEASADKTNILRILGLTHDNTVIDSNTYNSGGGLLSSRIRHYDSKIHAEAAGLLGLLDTWTVSAVYDGNKLIKYTVVRE